MARHELAVQPGLDVHARRAIRRLRQLGIRLLRDDAELEHAGGARRDDGPAEVRRAGIEREDVAGADRRAAALRKPAASRALMR